MTTVTETSLDRMGTLADVARALGISPQAVTKHRKSGLIRPDANGRVHVGRSVEAVQLARDPDAALKGLAGGAARSADAPEQADEIEAAVAETGTAPKITQVLAKARAVGAIADAKAKELRLARDRGELIPRDAARRACLAVIAEVKTRLDGLPAQAAPIVHAAPTVAEGEALLRGMVRAVLVELAKLGEAS